MPQELFSGSSMDDGAIGCGEQDGVEGSDHDEVGRDSHRRVSTCSAGFVTASSLPLLMTILVVAVFKSGDAFKFHPLTRHYLPSRSYTSSLASIRNPLELNMSMSDDDENKSPSFMQLQSPIFTTEQQHDDKRDSLLPKQHQLQIPQAQIIQLETLSRVLLPSFLSSILAYTLFPSLALYLSYLINDSATFAVLSVDSSQFIQNFLTVTGLTFSILVGQTYYFMYQQQEAVFVSLFWEVTEAKSLLEQVALVSQGRRDMYEMCLVAVKRCVCDVHVLEYFLVQRVGVCRWGWGVSLWMQTALDALCIDNMSSSNTTQSLYFHLPQICGGRFKEGIGERTSKGIECEADG
jgi:hypothetical protein